MERGLDRSLDDILADRRQQNANNRGPRAGRRRDGKSDHHRDAVRKSHRDDVPRDLDAEWVHDKFDEHGSRRSAPRNRNSPEPSRGSKLRVDNIHYELTQEDLEGLFARIGPIIKLDMKYDRAGRSEGTAFVTYESHRDALQAVKEFDGANAAGQPIRLTLMPSGPRRNPFETAVVPGRPLAERITVPGGRSRSLSPGRRGDQFSDENGGRRGGRRGGGGDLYRPSGGNRLSRSRSPIGGGGGRRRDGGGGRRPGPKGDRGGGGRRGDRGGARGGGEGGEKAGRDRRPKKTQEELDAEMEDYFAGGGGDAQAEAAVAPAAIGNGVQQDEDVDMIE